MTLGRFWKVKGPGLVIIVPIIQQAVRVDLRTVVLEAPTQDVISRDNVSVKVSAWCTCASSTQKAIIQVVDYLNATSQLAQTMLRSVPASISSTTCWRSGRNSIWTSSRR